VDSDGNLYIADTGANRIRKVSGGRDHHSGGKGALVQRRQRYGDQPPVGSSRAVAWTQPAILLADILATASAKVSGGVITTVGGKWTPGFSGTTVRRPTPSWYRWYRPWTSPARSTSPTLQPAHPQNLGRCDHHGAGGGSIILGDNARPPAPVGYSRQRRVDSPATFTSPVATHSAGLGRRDHHGGGKWDPWFKRRQRSATSAS